MIPMPFTNSTPVGLKRAYFRMCPDPDAYRFGILRMSSSIFAEMWVLAFAEEP